MTDPHTVTDESDSEDIGDVFPINPDVRNDGVGEGGDGTDPLLPKDLPNPQFDTREGE